MIISLSLWMFTGIFVSFVSLPTGSILQKGIDHREHHDFVTWRVGVCVHIGVGEGCHGHVKIEFQASKYSRAQSTPLHYYSCDIAYCQQPE